MVHRLKIYETKYKIETPLNRHSDLLRSGDKIGTYPTIISLDCVTFTRHRYNYCFVMNALKNRLPFFRR